MPSFLRSRATSIKHQTPQASASPATPAQQTTQIPEPYIWDPPNGLKSHRWDQPRYQGEFLENDAAGDERQEEDKLQHVTSPTKLLHGFLERTKTLRIKRGFSVRSKGSPRAQGPEPASPSQSHEASTHHSTPSPTVKPPPRQPPETNKPLPPPPPLSIITNPVPSRPRLNSAQTSPKLVVKLNRIMDILSEDQIEKLFSGAPHFYARSESHFTGAPHPSVAFPYDEELEIRDLTDCMSIDDKAWSGVSAWPHLTKDVRRDSAAAKRARAHRKAHFHIKCRERPNMLSMQGLEKGTMGYQAALELPVGDSLGEEQFGFGSIGAKERAIVEARQRMLSEMGWLQHLPETDVMDRLKRNGERYRNNDMKNRSSAETHNDLFDTLLRAGQGILVDKTDPQSIPNQIDSLLKCLGSPNVWIDLSRVEWRIRLGQILWGRSDGDELVDATEITDAQTRKERDDERYWLLLQVLVATELLLRLDAVTEGQEFGFNFRQIDIVRFERAANTSVKWSLFLARSWLENIVVVKEPLSAAAAAAAAAEKQEEPPKQLTESTGSWLAALVSKLSLYQHHRHHETNERPPSAPHHYTIRGRHGERQVDGLMHFARKLRWPGLDEYEARIMAKAEKLMDQSQTPMPTSTTMATMQSKQSYFGAWDITGGKGHKRDRVQAQRRKMAAALHASGWLSKSYIFGLLLPGEALSHFLMSTLLENDVQALSRLGSFANLCGGFVYSGMSFWSTSCIVGRVLAAGEGAAECLGWISTDVVPDGLGEGWVNVCTEECSDDIKNSGKKARIWGKRKIEKDSSILGDGDEDSVLPADFIMPSDGTYSKPPPSFTIDLRSFKLLSSTESVHPTPLSELTPMPSHTTEESYVPDLSSYPASISFNVSMNGQSPEEHTFSLKYDVSFVTSHPCAPSSRVKILKSPSSPTIQHIDVSGSDMLGATSRSVQRNGHPLHKSYNYNVIHLSELLQRRHYFLEDFLPNPTTTTTAKPSKTNTNRVLVIDCITNSLDVPASPMLDRPTPSSSPIVDRRGSFTFPPSTPSQPNLESRRRNVGSDMEILVRALCAQNGWNALISRRKRGCLACAVREAGALGWKVIVRVP